MHKVPISLFAAVLILVFGLVRSAAAESIKRAEKKDIEMLLSAASGRNSAYIASLIGETRERVYIEYMTAIHAGSLFSKKMKRVVYWLPHSELTEEQLAEFKAYKEKEAYFDPQAH
ncbi:MAG: hypothetical protein LBE22_09595 [Azoarcus sp.]|jgi:hypothetical protein|nr:hypothetical protein [Azoarcus sp.]